MSTLPPLAWWYVSLPSMEQPVCIFLHGWGHSHAAMLPLARQLGCSSILFDLPGFGRSPFPDGAWSIADYAHSLHQQLVTMGISKCVIVAHSFGGRVAIKYASLYPEGLQAVVLLAAAGLKRSQPILKVVARRLARMPATLLQHIGLNDVAAQYLDFWRAQYGSKDYLNAGAMRPILVKAVCEDLSKNASDIQVPTFLAVGSEDAQAPPDISLRLARLIPKASLHQLPGLDHYSLLDQGRFLLAHKIRGFLDACGSV